MLQITSHSNQGIVWTWTNFEIMFRNFHAQAFQAQATKHILDNPKVSDAVQYSSKLPLTLHNILL